MKLDSGLPINGGRRLFGIRAALKSLQDDIVSPIGELVQADDPAHATQVMNRRCFIVLFFPPFLQEDHTDAMAVTGGILDHFTVSRFENVQRKVGFRKKDHGGKRKNGNDFRNAEGLGSGWRKFQ